MFYMVSSTKMHHLEEVMKKPEVKRLSVSIPKDIYEKLRKDAFKMRISLATLVRKAVCNEVDK